MKSDAQATTHPVAKDSQRSVSFDGIMADATLDLRGLWCPLPPLKTVKALGSMKPGQVLEVLGTNPIGNKVAPWVAQRFGDQLLGVVEDDGDFHRFYFRKS